MTRKQDATLPRRVADHLVAADSHQLRLAMTQTPRLLAAALTTCMLLTVAPDTSRHATGENTPTPAGSTHPTVAHKHHHTHHHTYHHTYHHTRHEHREAPGLTGRQRLSPHTSPKHNDSHGDHRHAGAALVPVDPLRVVDTRTTSSPLSKGTQLDIGVGDVASGGDVVAVVANITVVDANESGYVTVWPAGTPKPDTSALNVGAGQTVAATTTVPVTTNTMSLYTSGGGHLLVDDQAVYVASDATHTGRFQPTTPTRLLDTRTANNITWRDRPHRVDVRTVGVPDDATAVAINVTGINFDGDGYITVWGSGPRPNVSNVNVEHGGTRANAAVVGIDDNHITLYTAVDGDIVVDLTGYYTGDTAPVTTTGLYVPQSPVRALDTRTGSRVDAHTSVAAGIETVVGPQTTAPLAVTGTVTVVDANEPGYVTVWANNTQRPSSSNANQPGTPQTATANMVTVGAGDTGIAVYTSSEAHLLFDITGWFHGELETREPDATAPPNSPASPHPPPADTENDEPAPPGPRPIVYPTRPVVGVDLPPSRGPHTFLYTHNNDQHSYARWNPCRTIRYVVDETGSSPSQQALLTDVVETVSDATGLTFEHVGTTSDGAEGAVPGEADILLAFTNQTRSPPTRRCCRHRRWRLHAQKRHTVRSRARVGAARHSCR